MCVGIQKFVSEHFEKEELYLKRRKGNLKEGFHMNVWFELMSPEKKLSPNKL